MKCPNCGKDLPEDALFCTECGATLGNGNASAEVKNQDNAVNEVVQGFAKTNSNFLVPGENIICVATWNKLPFLIFWGLFILSFIIFAANSGGFTWNLGSTLFILFILVVIAIITIYLFIYSRELVLTDKKLYGRTGLIGIRQASIPLKKINYIGVSYTIIGRLINSAIFTVYPGTLIPVSFLFVSNAQEFRTAVEMEINKQN